MPETRPERTGWRDEAISRRHREWGACAGVDIDFLLVEYRAGYPYALIEYKNKTSELGKAILAKNWTEANNILCDNTYQALRNLGDKAKIPVLVCIYDKNDRSKYIVFALNYYAKTYVPQLKMYDEIGYVQLLYEIRGMIMPVSLIEKLKGSEEHERHNQNRAS